jgi:hypothetical protein
VTAGDRQEVRRGRTGDRKADGFIERVGFPLDSGQRHASREKRQAGRGRRSAKCRAGPMRSLVHGR